VADEHHFPPPAGSEEHRGHWLHRLTGWLFTDQHRQGTSAHHPPALEPQGPRGRHRQYLADLRLAQSAWREGNPLEAIAHLARHLPEDGPDYRGFEWGYLWRLCHRDVGRQDIAGPVYSLAFRPDGTLAVGGVAGGVFADPPRGHLRLLDPNTGAPLLTLESSAIAARVAFSPSGQDLFALRLDGAAWIEILSVRDGQSRTPCDPFRPRITDLVAGTRAALASGLPEDLLPHVGWAAAFDAIHGRMIVCHTRLVEVVDLHRTGSKKPLLTLERPNDLLLAPAVSPDGQRLALATACEGVLVCEIATGKLVRVLPHRVPVPALAYSPDGQWLATGGTDGGVRLWDAESGKENHSPGGLRGPVAAIAFSPDGSRLAAGGGTDREGEIRLWETDSWEPAFDLPGHALPVRCLAFHPSSELLASGSAVESRWLCAGELKLWDLRRQRDVRVVSGPPGRGGGGGAPAP
jgi:WD40 repeat protein